MTAALAIGLAGQASAGDSGHHVSGKAPGDQRYLRDGGAVRIQLPRRSREGKDGERGRIQSISGIDRLTGDDTLEDAREDNLGTAPDIYSTGEREEFIEDGGVPVIEHRAGITVLRGNTSGHWRHVVVEPIDLSERGSFAFIATDVGYEPGNRGSYQRLPTEGFRDSPSYRPLPTGPKIIDVETERLDRRPIPASGIETISSGGAKIIRIARDYQSSAYRVGTRDNGLK
ncbi:hypothetical protein E3C22_05850 [Jiella endophytica]|uniref:Uncharacterized protein n=1 Tax=Jiella endophytica TaxID=2558362 RepID=A0A4Y8RMX2_9HYPH|nr:hypothetical protein [Jiella endophytica]TFF24909.1 hypothetical protein E3C22_05850 [Jiella endophytica]